MRKYYRLGHNPLNFGARHGDSSKQISQERKLEDLTLSEFTRKSQQLTPSQSPATGMELQLGQRRRLIRFGLDVNSFFFFFFFLLSFFFFSVFKRVGSNQNSIIQVNNNIYFSSYKGLNHITKHVSTIEQVEKQALTFLGFKMSY